MKKAQRQICHFRRLRRRATFFRDYENRPRGRPSSLRVATCLAVQILIATFAFAANNPAPDPAVPGPFAVTRTDYDFGTEALALPDFPRPVEVTASVHYPTDLTAGLFPSSCLFTGCTPPASKEHSGTG